MPDFPPTDGSAISLRQRLTGGPAAGVLRGMATLVAGNASARLLGILVIPVTTRLYTPEDFGALAVFVAFVMILAPLVTLRYIMALPLPRRDSVAVNLLALSGGLLLVTGVLLSLVLWLAGRQILRFFSMEVLEPFLPLIVAGVLGLAAYEAMTLWATRKRAYTPIAKTLAIQSLAGNSVKVLLGLLALKPVGLLIGQVIVSAGGVASLWYRFSGEILRQRHRITRARLRMVALRYRDFPAYRLPSQFLLMLAMQAPLLLSALIFDPGTVGQLSLALLAVAMPVDLVANSMGKAYYAEISVLGRHQARKIRQITRSITLRMLLVAAPLVVVMVLFAEPLFVRVFGPQWQQAGVFCSILAVYILFNFISNPVQHVFNVFRKNSVYLWLSVQRLIIVGVLFGLAVHWQLSATGWVALYSAGLSAHYVLVCFRVFGCIREQVRLSESGRSAGTAHQHPEQGGVSHHENPL